MGGPRRTNGQGAQWPQPNAPQPGERHGELMILVSNQKVFGKGAGLHCNSRDGRASNARIAAACAARGALTMGICSPVPCICSVERACIHEPTLLA